MKKKGNPEDGGMSLGERIEDGAQKQTSKAEGASLTQHALSRCQRTLPSPSPKKATGRVAVLEWALQCARGGSSSATVMRLSVLHPCGESCC